MTTAYTSLLGLALPVTGELAGTWGDTVNDYITQYLDASVAGTQTISGSQTAVTLSKTTNASLSQAGTGATGSSQYNIINCTGNPASLLTITAPAQSKTYLIINATSTNQSVKIVGAGPTTGVTLIAGERALVAWNGSDFIKVATTAAAAGSNTQVQYNSGGNLAGSANLTFDGTNLTLGGGTANGVAYLNGSKVLTTGSALRFNGTQLSLNSAPSGNYPLTIRSVVADYTKILDWGTDAGGSWGTMTINTSSPYETILNSGVWQFNIANSEQMRLTSTGLGIGTSSPGQKLEVVGAITSSGALTAQQTSKAVIAFNSGNAELRSYGAVGTVGGINFLQGSGGSAPTTTMSLDSSGNLGLGVTPSAWSGVNGVFEIKGNAYVYSTTGVLSSGANAYFNGTNWIYKTTQAATRYEQVNGQHQWGVAPSGTAGNTISFTQAMTLDASGNLALGHTSTPATRLDVRTSLSATANPQWISDFYAITSGSTDGTYGGGIRLYTKNVNGNYWPAAIAAINDAGGSNLSSLGFYTATSGPTLNERARITSDGDLLVGKTSVGVAVGGEMQANGLVTSTRSGSTNATSSFQLYSTGVGLYRFYVGMDGVVNATNTTISAISDQRLKENIQDIDVGLDKIMALKPRKFDWKPGKGKDIKGDRGWIAQEFEQVFPDMIGTWLDPSPEGEEPYKSVRADLIPVLVKAIQEQQAIITDLRARVAQLEAK